MTARLRHLRHRNLDGLARGRLDRTRAGLSLGIPAGNKRTFVFTANNVTDFITVTGQNNLATNHPRVVLVGTLPAGLVPGRIYFLSDTGADTYSLHSTKAAAVAGTGDINFTTNGTGNLTMIALD